MRAPYGAPCLAQDGKALQQAALGAAVPAASVVLHGLLRLLPKLAARARPAARALPSFLPLLCGFRLQGHKFILEARSPVFRALLNADMREKREGRVDIQGIRAPVFRALLHYVYTDTLPDGVSAPRPPAAAAATVALVV